ncbi:MAG: VanZ family protein [Myxococcota bacterium]
MPLDAWVLELLPDRGSVPVFDAAMIAATTVGLLAFVVGGPWWLGRRVPRLARAIVAAEVFGLASTLVLQWLTQRPRPIVADPLLPLPPSASFPSGHAVLVAIVVVPLLARRPRSAWWLAPAALAVGLSRVHVGHHHASDVLAGLLLGLGIGVGAWTWARAAPRDPWRHRWLLWPQLGLVLAVTLIAYTGAFSRSQLWWLALPGMDKVLHCLLFGLLALGVHLQTRGRTIPVGRWRLPLAVLLPLTGAALEELAQASSPHRTADWIDLLADTVGMLLFWRLGVRLTSAPRPPGQPAILGRPRDTVPNEKLRPVPESAHGTPNPSGTCR